MQLRSCCRSLHSITISVCLAACVGAGHAGPVELDGNESLELSLHTRAAECLQLHRLLPTGLLARRMNRRGIYPTMQPRIKNDTDDVGLRVRSGRLHPGGVILACSALLVVKSVYRVGLAGQLATTS